MKIKFKKLREDAIIPTRATDGSAGFDLTAVDFSIDCNIITYDTGLAVQLPKGYVGLLVPRSSVYRMQLSLCNSCGILDWDYTGSVKFKFYTHSRAALKYQVGDRIGQLVVVPCITEAEEVSELSETIRGSGGWGHSGK
jgi:dUTP pyrophosphatase